MLAECGSPVAAQSNRAFICRSLRCAQLLDLADEFQNLLAFAFAEIEKANPHCIAVVDSLNYSAQTERQAFEPELHLHARVNAHRESDRRCGCGSRSGSSPQCGPGASIQSSRGRSLRRVSTSWRVFGGVPGARGSAQFAYWSRLRTPAHRAIRVPRNFIPATATGSRLPSSIRPIAFRPATFGASCSATSKFTASPRASALLLHLANHVGQLHHAPRDRYSRSGRQVRCCCRSIAQRPETGATTPFDPEEDLPTGNRAHAVTRSVRRRRQPSWLKSTKRAWCGAP